MTRQRLTKRQIREDPLVTWTYNARAWVSDNMNRLLIGAIAVLVLVGGGMALRNSRQGAEESAAAQLARAQFQLWGNNTAQALELAEDVIARWPGTRSAVHSELVRADALLQSGRAREAIDGYSAFLDKTKDESMRIVALRGKAAALEDSGQYAVAAGEYETLARQHDRGPVVAIDLMAAARCRELQGDPSAARALYEEVLRDHPNLQERNLLEIKLRELGAAPQS